MVGGCTAKTDPMAWVRIFRNSKLKDDDPVALQEVLDDHYGTPKETKY